MSQATPQSETPVTPDNNRKKWLVLAGAVAATAWLGHSLWFNARYVSTDNAQIGGDIVPVSARISGFVTEVPVRENQLVKAGDLLAVLDDRDARARLAQAEAELANALTNAGRSGQAEAQVESAQAQSQQAQAVIAQAAAEYDNAHREAGRLRSLLSRNLISQAQVDAADAHERALQARLQATRDAAQAANRQVGVFHAAVRGADARLLAVRAARDLAANTLADTRVVASMAGMISQKTLEPGQFMQPGQPMMNLVGLDSVWVVANLKETEIEGVQIGNTVEFEVDAYPGETWEGTVESMSPATGSKFTLLPPDNATGNFTKVVQRLPVRVHIKSGQHAGMTLRPGMSAVVTIRRS